MCPCKCPCARFATFRLAPAFPAATHPHTQAEHAAFAELLAGPQEEAKSIARRRFPVPRIVDCDQGGSQVSRPPAAGTAAHAPHLDNTWTPTPAQACITMPAF
jgi:hypothetical protein